MVKKSIFIVYFTAFSFASKSQNVSLGPIIGLNYATISNTPEAESKFGFTGGVFANYSTKTNFGFNGSVIYSQLGDRVKVANNTNSFKLNYLQVPVNLVYYFGEGMKSGSFRPKVFIGPYIAYLLSAESPGMSKAQTYQLLNDTDFGINLGTGFNYALKSKSWINVDLKYGIGLENVPKILKYQNRNLSLNVGLSFPLGTYDKKTGKLKGM